MDRVGFDLADAASMQAKATADAVTREAEGDGVAVQVWDEQGRIVHANVVFGGR